MRHRLPTERSFGLTVGAACLLLGALLRWRGHLGSGPVVITVGAALIAAGAVVPSILRIPNRLWSRFAMALGWVNSRILLSVVFVAVLTPVGIVLRAFGRSPLKPVAGTTNWSDYAERRRSTRHYEHLS
jgi:hypothetical protein